MSGPHRKEGMGGTRECGDFEARRLVTDNRYDMCVTERIATVRENPGAGILAWVSPLSGGSGQLRPEHSKEVGLIGRKAWVGCAG